MLLGYLHVYDQLTTIFKYIFSKTAWPIKAKVYVEPPWEGGEKVYINGPGHMTKIKNKHKQTNKLKTTTKNSKQTKQQLEK